MSRFTDAKNSIDNKTYDGFFSTLEHYDREYASGQKWLDSLDRTSQIFAPTLVAEVLLKTPGMMSYYYQLAQEADKIKEYILDKANVIKVLHLKRFIENYARALSDRTAEKYAEAEQDYVAMRELAGEMSLRYERIVGLSKGIAEIGWNARSLNELRKMGIEDATL